jgi:hypothetical protein
MFISSHVSFRMKFFYLSIFIFPLLSIVTCTSLFLARAGGGARPRVPSWSELVADPPQSRIWGVSMTIESVGVLLFGAVRDHMLTFLVRRSDGPPALLCVFLLRLSRLLVVVAAVALIVVACVTCDDSPLLHTIAAAAWFGTLGLYFAFGDYINWAIKRPVRIPSIILTAVIICTFVAATITQSAAAGNGVRTASALLGYVAVVSVLIKVVAVWKEMPEHGLRIMKKPSVRGDQTSDN